MLSQPAFLSIYAAYPAALAWAGSGRAWAARDLRPIDAGASQDA